MVTQRIASPFLLLFSTVVIFMGLVAAVAGVVERNVDAVCGGLLFLALGTAGVWQAVRGIVGGHYAEEDSEAADSGNLRASVFTPHANALVAAQRARRAAILLAWCVLALSVYIALFTQLPHVVAVLIFFAGFAPYILSIKVIEPWLLRRSESAQIEDSR